MGDDDGPAHRPKLIDGQPLLSESPELRTAAAIGGVLYALMQGYYAWLTLHEMWRLRKSVASYYDRIMSDMLNWMERSVSLLALIALLVPLIIFMRGKRLGLFALIAFAAVFYFVICFLCYLVSNDQRLVEIAETQDRPSPSDEKDSTPAPSETDREASFAHIASAVEEWTAGGGHLQQELNIQTVADEMHVQRPLLTAWLKTTEWEVFAKWLTYLRIEEAKKVLKEHPDWSNDYVAQHCGFSSRTYFQKKFKEMVGIPPGEFIRVLD